MWLPDDRYVRLEGLALIPTSEWRRAHRHAFRIVEALAPWRDARATDLLGVGVGFDDGDVEIVWSDRGSNS